MKEFDVAILIIVGLTIGAIAYGVWRHKRNVQSKLHNQV